MDWREVRVDADPAAVEAATEILVDCGAGGVVVEDPELIKAQIALNIWDAYEFPEELLARGFVRVKAYFPEDRKIEEHIADLRTRLTVLGKKYLPGAIKGVNFSQVREEDWANSWKKYYKPVKAGKRIVIKPSWEKYDQGPGELIIELDPGMAFGTGTHPTTTMCIQALENIIQGGERAFDIGTGSGILAIASALLGAREVKAVDIDEVAVEAARANVLRNHVEDIVEVMAGNLLDRVTGQADIVVANIVADIVIRVCPDAARAVRPGGIFLASGIIAPRSAEVQQAVGSHGFKIVEIYRQGDWVSVKAIREE